MSRKQENKIEYFVVCVNEFARRHHITTKEAFAYLDRYNALNVLDRIYDTEHLFSVDDAIDDLTLLCNHNGGAYV